MDMKRRMIYWVRQLRPLPLLFALIANGCIRDKLTDCPPTEIVYLRVIDINSGDDITDEGRVKEATLFVFDQNRKFIERIDINAGYLEDEIIIPLKGYTAGEFYVSAWGNISAYIDNARIAPGEDYDDDFLKLFDAGKSMKQSPNEMFFGLKKIYIAEAATRTTEIQREEVDITQINAGLSVTVRGLPDEAAAEDYYFRLLRQNIGYNFWGEPIEGNYEIREGGTFNSDGEFISRQPVFLIHSAEPEAIDESNCTILHLYQKGATPEQDIDLTGAILQDREEQYIFLARGTTTHILIDLTADLRVQMAVTSWDEIYLWDEW